MGMKLKLNPFRADPEVSTSDPFGSVVAAVMFVLSVMAFVALAAIGLVYSVPLRNMIAEALGLDRARGDSATGDSGRSTWGVAT
jgi:hypothetical protein